MKKIIFLLFLFCLISFVGANTLLNGLIAYFNMDSGCGLVFGTDLSCTMGSVTTNLAGKIGNATYNTSSVGHFRINDTTNKLRFDTNDYSVSVWFRRENTSSGEETVVYRRVTNQFHTTYFLRLWNGDKNITYTTLYANPDGSNLYSGIQANSNEWYHVVITAKVGGQRRIYVNGQLRNQFQYNYFDKGGGTLGTYPTCVGCVPDIGEGGFVGRIDELGFWNRELTQEEITYLYNNGNGITYPFTVRSDFDYFSFFDGNQKLLLRNNSLKHPSYDWNDQEWRVNNNLIATTWDANFQPISLNTDYNVCLTQRAKDVNNNIYTHTTCRILRFTEFGAPTTSFSYNQVAGTYDANITFTCNDGNGTGCKTLYYRINDGNWITIDYPQDVNYDFNVGVSWTSWHSGEPNNANGIEDCATMWANTFGKWNDFSCSDTTNVYALCAYDSNKQYVRSPNTMSWFQARDYCLSLGPGWTLAIARNSTENTSAFNACGASNHCWLGLYQLNKNNEPAGNWAWERIVNRIYDSNRISVLLPNAFSINRISYYSIDRNNNLETAKTEIVHMLDRNLIAYYKFDETSGTTAIDWHGFDNNGSNNGATIGTTGKIGNAYGPFGSDKKIILNNAHANINNYDKNFTICSWIYPTTIDTTYRYVVSVPGDATGSFNYIFYVRNNSVAFAACKVNVSCNEASTTISTNTWSFVCGTHSNTTNGIKLYKDGNLASQTTWTQGTTTAHTSNIVIGNSMSNSTNFLGLIDELGIWSRVLTQEEITYLYNNGNGRTYPFTVRSDFDYFSFFDGNQRLLLRNSSWKDVNFDWSSQEWRVNNNLIATTWDANFQPISLNTDYNVCLTQRVKDVNNNIYPSSTTCKVLRFVEFNAPLTSFSYYQVPLTYDANMTFICNDGNGTGCKTLYYKIGDGNWIIRDYIPDVNYDFNVAVSWTNWMSGQPDNAGGTQDCAHFHANASGVWNDGTCSDTVTVRALCAYDSNKQYVISSNTMSWFQARDYCLSLGPGWTLAIARNSTENTSAFNACGASNHCWLGLYQLNKNNEPAGNWAWERIVNRIYDSNRINIYLSNIPGNRTIYYYSIDKNNNQESVKSSNVYIISGQIVFYFFNDMNQSLTNVIVNFNGTNYDSGSNNYVIIDLNAISEDYNTYSFLVTKTGYNQKIVKYYLNKNSLISENIFLTPTSYTFTASYSLIDAPTTWQSQYLTRLLGVRANRPITNIIFKINNQSVTPNYTYGIDYFNQDFNRRFINAYNNFPSTLIREKPTSTIDINNNIAINYEGFTFNGNDSYFASPIIDANILLDPFTFTAWVKFNHTNPQGVIGIQDVLNQGSGSRLFIVNIGGAANCIYAYNLGSYSSCVPIDANQWYHIAYVKKDNNQVDFYVNGVLRQTINPQLGFFYNNQRLYVGNTYPGYFSGVQDNIRFFRRALTSTDVNMLYMQGLNEIDQCDRGVWFDYSTRNRVCDLNRVNVTITPSGLQFSSSNNSYAVSQKIFSQEFFAKSFTVSFWMYTYDVNGWNGVFAFQTALNDPGSPGLFLINKSNNCLQAFNVGIYSSCAYIDANQWYHVAYVKKDNNQVDFYVNGSKVSTVNPYFVFSYSIQRLYIGNSYPGYFNGLINNFIIYDRNLSDSDVNTIYLNGNNSNILFPENLMFAYNNEYFDANRIIDRGNFDSGTKGASYSHRLGNKYFILNPAVKLFDTNILVLGLRVKLFKNPSVTETIFNHNSSSNPFRLELYGNNDVNLLIGNRQINILVNNEYANGDWIHFLFERNITANTIKVYVNGILKRNESLSGISNPYDEKEFFIGSRNGLTNFFRGSLNNFDIYKRILDSNEIMFLVDTNQNGYYGLFDLNYFINIDGNNLAKLELFNNFASDEITWNVPIDVSAPTVGQTTVSGFTTYNNYITGTGTIVGGIATDSKSGINTTTCQFTDNNGSTWQTATWDVNKCIKTNYTINNGITYWFNTRVSDNVGNIGIGLPVSYIGDTIGPSVGQTIVGNGLYISDNNLWIGGTGTIIGGTASDAGSGINTTTCQFTDNNGSTWQTATWNNNRCEKTGYTINDGITYIFNTRVADNLNQYGVGLSTRSYTGDAVAPITTYSGCGTGWHTSSRTITLSCSDSKSGCDNTAYRLNNGSWITYTGSFILSTDANHKVDYNSMDKVRNIETTKTSYCAIDTTPPSVGTTTISGFTTYGTFFKGPGTIVGGTATDSVSGINTTTCQFTDNNGSTWQTATWNNNRCEKTNWTGINGQKYIFNTRVNNNAGLLGTGTSTIQYTYDSNAPIVTLTYSYPNPYVPDVNVVLMCNDQNGSGCKSLWYKVDNGAWTQATGPGAPDVNSFMITGFGTRIIQYYAVDQLDNNGFSSMYTTTLNLPGVLRIRIIDENTNASLQNVIVNFNDQNHIVTAYDNWINYNNILSVVYHPNSNIYVGIGNGRFGYYSPSTNLWIDLSNTDNNNWVGLSNVNSLIVTPDGNIYTGLSDGKFGRYSPTTNQWIDLSNTDAGNWVGNSIVYSLTYHQDGNIYTGIGDGNFGRYSPITNQWIRLSDTDSSNWVGASHVLSVMYRFDGNIYTGMSGGKFGRYSPITNVWTDLSNTDDSNWAGIDFVYSLVNHQDGNIYTGLSNGKFGRYSPITNVWTNLSTTDPGDWVGTSHVYSLLYYSDNNIYTGLGDGEFGRYSPITNQWVDLSNTDPNNWVGTSIVYGMASTPNNDIYTGISLGKFGRYTPTNNTWAMLSLLDPQSTLISLSAVTPGIKTLTFMAPNYGTRYYDLNIYSIDVNYDINMLMLESSKGSYVLFRYFKSDNTTLINNGFVNFYRPDKNFFSIGQKQILVNGLATFFVSNRDQNYVQRIIDQTEPTRNMYPIKLIVLPPIDEVSLVNITTQKDGNSWGITALSNMVFRRTDVNYFGGEYPTYPGAISLYVLPNTEYPTLLQIYDMNAYYFPRIYGVQYIGDENVNRIEFLQPYLVQYLQGNQTVFIIMNQLGYAIPGITVKIYRMINNQRTLIASGTTDSTGSYTAPLVITANYNFELYANNVKISPSQFNLQITENKYYFTINTFGYPVDDKIISLNRVEWIPFTEYVYNATSLSQKISGPTVSAVNVQIYQYKDANNTRRLLRYEKLFICNKQCIISQVFNEMTLNGGLDTNLPLIVDLNVYYDGNKYYQPFKKTYRLKRMNTVDLMQLITNAKRSFGCEPTHESICPWTIILSILLSIFAMGSMIYVLKVYNPFAMILVGAGTLIFFILTGWFYWPLIVPAAIILVLYFGRKGSE